MGFRITYRQVVARLEESALPYGILTLQQGASIVISQRGGRILGPFLTPDSESILWINDVFTSPDAFKKFLDSNHWNLGGERVWMAPELQYAVPDRNNFWGSYTLSPQVDPGHYILEQVKSGQWRLSQDMNLDVYTSTTSRKELHLERLISIAEDPLRKLSNYVDLVDGITFFGYEQRMTLSETRHDDLLSQTWSLVQLNPGGMLLISALPTVEYTCYYEPVDDNIHSIHNNYVRLKITGDRRYKLGYKAVHILGRLAYFNHLNNDRAYLIVRNFFNNPSAPYPDEPYHLPGHQGDSVHIYNDDGGLGGFGELECQGQAIGGETGKSVITDQMVLWFYIGAPDKVKELVKHLIGVEL
jgi:hypothetical protein